VRPAEDHVFSTGSATPGAVEPVHVAPPARRAMYELAQRDRKREVCAFLEGTGRRVLEIHPTRNVHPESATRYAVDPAAFLELEDALEDGATEVVGVFHTHPATPAVPSATDRAHAQPGWFYLILGFPPATPNGELRAWSLPADDPAGAFMELPLVAPEVTT
jgi:proteasome lid subunit RPN8/RPN11